MPVDVASGTVNLDAEELRVPGRVDLIWERRFSTGFLSRPPGPLGRGWTSRYFSSLTRREDHFEYVTADGGVEIIPDVEGRVDRGGTAVLPAAFLEVFRARDRYIVRRWNVETGEVVCYGYPAAPVGVRAPLVSIENAGGEGLDVGWDGGALVLVRQRLEQRALLFRYTPSGLLDSVVLRSVEGVAHLVSRYEYDGQGRLVAAFDAAGSADRYEYDARDRLTREILRDGGVFTYGYDAESRCNRTSGLDRYQLKRLRFMTAAGVTEVTDSYGAASQYQYLPSGQIVRETDPLGAQKTIDYDEHGRIVARTDATGAVTRYAYDARGNRSTITDALGHTLTFTYTDDHLPLTLTDALGAEWRRVYDRWNRLVESINPLGERWTLRYDPEGNAIEVVNPLGATLRRRFVRGVVVEETDWGGNPTRYLHDAFGRVTSRQGSLGEVTRFRYDAAGNPVEVVLPDGAVLQGVYDPAGNLTEFIDGNGHSTRYRYGTCRRLLERVDPTGAAVRYEWGTEPGRLLRVVNEKGEPYTFLYDEAGRVVREVSFDGAERRFQRDAEGNVIGFVNGNGETVGIQRDALHRMVGHVLPDGQATLLRYDARDRLVEAVKDATVVAFERDPLGRIIREVQGEDWVATEYDAAGHPTRTLTSRGLDAHYTLDANGLVQRLDTGSGQLLAFERDAYGHETSRRSSAGVLVEQAYDPVGRLVGQTLGPGMARTTGGAPVIPPERPVIRRVFAYDRAGSLTSITGPWNAVDYAYDPAERLLRALREHGVSEHFVYDAAGNVTHAGEERDGSRAVEARVYGPGNRLLQKGGTRYEYDDEGRRTARIDDAESDSPRVWRYRWDALDLLTRVESPDGEVWRYRYDALGRRIEKEGPAERVRYLWDRQVIVHESGAAGAGSAWVFDPYTFVPLASVQNGHLYSVVTDHLGTPTELVDGTGAIAWSLAHRAFGGDLPGSPRAAGNVTCPIRFQGQWRDEESGLHYNHLRYYDPQTGHFASQDPVRLWGGIHQYRYAINPINWLDPWGLCILANAAAGKAWEGTVTGTAQGKYGTGNVQTQVMVRPLDASGNPVGYRVRVDNVITQPGAPPRLIDAKASTTAGYTPNQTTGYPLIGTNGGIIESGPLAGTTIAPTTVQRVDPSNIGKL